MDPHDLERALSFQFVRPEKITRNDVAWLMNRFVPAAVEELRRLYADEEVWTLIERSLTEHESMLLAAEAERDRALEALRDYDEWASRMPDAGFTDADPPRWGWWHKRPSAAARAVLGETDG